MDRAALLREGNAPTHNGGTWRPSTIWGMWRNRFYTGWVGFDGSVVNAQHDAIVSEVLFNSGLGAP